MTVLQLLRLMVLCCISASPPSPPPTGPGVAGMDVPVDATFDFDAAIDASTAADPSIAGTTGKLKSISCRNDKIVHSFHCSRNFSREGSLDLASSACNSIIYRGADIAIECKW